MFEDHYWHVAGQTPPIYSSARQEYVAEGDSAYQTWLEMGNVAPRLTSHEELVGVLRRLGVPPYHKVLTYTVVRRLEEAGKLAEAEAALNADRSAKWRFTTADSRGGVDADAEDVRAFLTAIGTDPDVILTPGE